MNAEKLCDVIVLAIVVAVMLVVSRVPPLPHTDDDSQPRLRSPGFAGDGRAGLSLRVCSRRPARLIRDA
jgi:hypothetical protein